MLKRQPKTYSFAWGTPWEEIVNFDPYKRHKEIAANILMAAAFISVEIFANLYVPKVPTPAFLPDNSLIDSATKAFETIKSIGL